MIKIYCHKNGTLDIPGDISECRKQKILSVKNDDAKRLAISSAIVLRQGFADLGISESEVIYGSGENGKPFSVNYPDVHFSISHTGNVSLCAFSDKEIGIDCEKRNRNISAEILDRYFTKAEAKAFSEDPLLLWVAKEAYVKYTGKGMALGRSDLELPFFSEDLKLNGLCFKRLSIGDILAVVCAEEAENISIIYLN